MVRASTTAEAGIAEARDEVNALLLDACEQLERGQALVLRRPELRKLHADFFITQDLANLQALIVKLRRAHKSAVVDPHMAGSLFECEAKLRSYEAEDVGSIRRYGNQPQSPRRSQDDSDIRSHTPWVRQEQVLCSEVKRSCSVLAMKLDKAF